LEGLWGSGKGARKRSFSGSSVPVKYFDYIPCPRMPLRAPKAFKIATLMFPWRGVQTSKTKR
jgi:hypothetical protein